MNIQEFWEFSAGKWFSQRTIHNLKQGSLQAGKAEFSLELLSNTDTQLQKICTDNHLDSSQIQGIKISWDGANKDDTKDVGSTMIVTVHDPADLQKGKLVQVKGDQYLSGNYHLGNDEVLTMVTESDDLYMEEKFWYLMPNLRLRTSVIQVKGGPEIASFYSEIRRINQPA